MLRTDSVGNKFEFVAIAAERCKQLQRGARPRSESNSRKWVTVAQEEVLAGQIEYSYGPFPEETAVEPEVGEVTTEAYPIDDNGSGKSE